MVGNERSVDDRHDLLRAKQRLEEVVEGQLVVGMPKNRVHCGLVAFEVGQSARRRRQCSEQSFELSRPLAAFELRAPPGKHQPQALPNLDHAQALLHRQEHGCPIHVVPQLRQVHRQQGFDFRVDNARESDHGGSLSGNAATVVGKQRHDGKRDKQDNWGGAAADLKDTRNRYTPDRPRLFPSSPVTSRVVTSEAGAPTHLRSPHIG